MPENKTVIWAGGNVSAPEHMRFVSINKLSIKIRFQRNRMTVVVQICLFYYLFVNYELESEPTPRQVKEIKYLNIRTHSNKASICNCAILNRPFFPFDLVLLNAWKYQDKGNSFLFPSDYLFFYSSNLAIYKNPKLYKETQYEQHWINQIYT